MSTAIKSSLIGLNESLEILEGAFERQQKKPKVPQHDLFGAASNRNSQSGDVKIFAKRLDSAIDKVEKLLKESHA